MADLVAIAQGLFTTVSNISGGLLSTEHVKAHSGHPLNDLADYLCDYSKKSSLFSSACPVFLNPSVIKRVVLSSFSFLDSSHRAQFSFLSQDSAVPVFQTLPASILASSYDECLAGSAAGPSVVLDDLNCISYNAQTSVSYTHLTLPTSDLV